MGTRPNITTGTLHFRFEKDKEIHLAVVWRGMQELIFRQGKKWLDLAAIIYLRSRS